MESKAEVLSSKKAERNFPLWGWVGLAFVAVFWPLNWLLDGVRTIWAFFPLWTGFALAVDGLVFLRTGTSQIHRSKPGFVSQFFISAPCWWIYEYLNQRVQNWHYIGVDGLSNLEFMLLSTLNFSIVIPAVFGMTELVSSFRWAKNMRVNIRIPDSNRAAAIVFTIGLGMAAALFLWPIYFFPFLWLSIYFILEPINLWMGNPGLFIFTDQKEWRPVLFFFIGALITGFFWEFWNYYSYPKWIYTVPFVGVAKIFEMPALGYFGYLPFSLELCAIVQFVNRIFNIKDSGLITVFSKTYLSK
jgi:hypothetical protein